MKSLFNKYPIILWILILIGTQCEAQDMLIGGRDLGASGLQARNSMLSCTPIFSYNTPELVEQGITSVGNFIWSGGSVDPWYYKTDYSTGIVTDSIPKPFSTSQEYGGDMDYDGNYLWTIIEQMGTLYKINPANGAIINQYVLPVYSPNAGDPNHWGVACNDNYVWYTEYAIAGSNPYLTYLFKLTTNAIVVDSFLMPHWILPIKFINGELWGNAFDTPYMFKIDPTSGALLDSVPRCVNNAYGLTSNNAGFWMCGISSFNNNRIHLFNGISTNTIEQEQISTSVSVFPNPVSDALHIKFDGKISNDVAIAIYDIVGARILTQKPLYKNDEVFINTSNLSPGVYLLFVGGLSEPLYYKWVKE